MRIRVLVLPYDGIGHKGQGPETHVVDPWPAARGKMARVVAQGTRKPGKNTKQYAPKIASLSYKGRERNEFRERKGPKARGCI
jgi:hypothetical protein